MRLGVNQTLPLLLRPARQSRDYRLMIIRCNRSKQELMALIGRLEIIDIISGNLIDRQEIKN